MSNEDKPTLERLAELRGALRQYDSMMQLVENLAGKEVAAKVRPLAEGAMTTHRSLLKELRKLKPKGANHTSQSARLRAYDLPDEPSQALVQALQADLAGRRKLAGMTPDEQAQHIATAAPERWVRNLLQATLLLAAENDKDDTP